MLPARRVGGEGPQDPRVDPGILLDPPREDLRRQGGPRQGSTSLLSGGGYQAQRLSATGTYYLCSI